MSAATIGLVGAVVAAVIAAFATVVGPVILQRRENQADAARQRQDEAVRREDLVNDVGVRCREWLLFLERTLRDAEAGRPKTVTAFDDRCQALRTPAEEAMARTSSAGYELWDSGLADALRMMELQVREALVTAAAPEDLAQLRQATSSYFTPRAIIRARMLREVREEREPTNPLEGTVFEQRHLPPAHGPRQTPE